MKHIKYYLFILAIGFVISCKKTETKASGKEIVSFKIENQIGDSKKDSAAATIAIVMPTGTDLSKVKPTIVVSDKAKISPVSDVETNFANGVVEYTVTAENGSTKKWSVSVVNAKRSDADILGFAISNQSFPTIYTSDSVYVLMPTGSLLTALVPTITTSPDATISPSGSVATDYSKGAVLYTVTAADGTIKIWKVKVRLASRNANIVSFIIPLLNDTGKITTTSVTVTVPYGTDLTKIVPTIVVSPGSKISPESGTSVDFSKGSVTYTVTPEDPSMPKGVYVVSVNINLPVFKVADNISSFNFIGRFTNLSTLPRTWAPGAYITANFTGTYCDVILNDQNLWGNNFNFIQIIVDDTIILRVRNTGKSNTIRVSSSLTSGTHSIVICKDTEAGIGYIEFVGLRCQGLATASVLPIHKIECIGNSITCGTGSDQSYQTCSLNPSNGSQWYYQHNAYYSYGARTARTLNAQYHLSSISGIGLIKSCCNRTDVISRDFDRLNLDTTGAVWDFNQYIPDVLTICLGQNDGIQSDSSKFLGAYVTFLQSIRTHYPNTQIVLITSPMANGSLLAQMIKYNAAVARRMKESGDNNVSSFAFSTTKSWNAGCDTHPSVAQHAEIASLLTNYIKTLMNW
jgi:lysophospholipase L1-like esterase